MFYVVQSKSTLLVTPDVSRLANPKVMFQSEASKACHEWVGKYFASKAKPVEAKPAVTPEALSREAAIAARKAGLAQAAKTLRTARKGSAEWVKAVEYIERLSH